MTQFQSWVAGIPLSIPPKVDQLPGAVETIAKGRLVYTNDAGQITIAVAATSARRPIFVNTKAFTNAGGSVDAPVDVVGQGQRVTVQTKSILEPGDPLKVSSTNGMVELFDVSSDDIHFRVGRYIGKEPGVYSKDVATPFAEGFTTDSGPEVNAAVDDIVAMELE